MALKDTLLRIFTWWNGQTVSLALMTARSGQFVGADEFGNRYYKAMGPLIDRSVGPERRWVIYNGYADASRVPPGWRGWLCHNADVPPSEEDYQPREWQKPHVENETGTERAYRPKGSQLSRGGASRRNRRLRAVVAGGVGVGSPQPTHGRPLRETHARRRPFSNTLPVSSAHRAGAAPAPRPSR